MNLAIFCNNFRGLKIINYLKKKNNICLVVLSKKNLNSNIFNNIKKKYKYLIVDNVNSAKVITKLNSLNIDINIIAGFPYIFKKELIKTAKFGTINLHGGPVPNYRGGSPLNWQIINNEKYIYISILKVNEKIDSGQLLCEKKFRLKRKDNINFIKKKAEKTFLKIIDKAISNLLKNKFIKKNRQRKDKYYYQRKPADSEIILKKMTNLNIFNIVRSSSNNYPAFLIINKKKIIVKKIKILNKILESKKNKIFKCKNGYVQIN